MNDTGSITKLTCLINGISMAGPHGTIPLESCEHIAKAIHTSGWLKQVHADAVREAANNLDQARTEVAGNKPDNPGWQYIAGGVKSAVIWLHRYADHHDRSRTDD